MTEAQYQRTVIQKIEEMFPGCLVLKNDPQYLQGILDWTILWGRCWAALEIKSSRSASSQPNQGYYVAKLDAMSFAAFIYPENEEEVLSALQSAFESPGRACVSQS